MNEILEGIRNAHDSVLEKWYKRYCERQKKIDLLHYTLRIDGLGNSAQTDANGNLTMIVYQNTIQRNLVIGRIMVWADGYTPAAPYSNAASWFAIQAGHGSGNLKDYGPYSPGAPFMPNIADYSGINGLRFSKSEPIIFALHSGPASTNITVRIFGFAEPSASDYEI